MSDKQQQYGFEDGVTVTPEGAWQVYAEMDKPTYLGLSKILAEQGHKVSYQTLQKWGKRFGWAHRIAMARSTQVIDPSSKDIFSVLKLKAEWMDPVTLRGLQASIAERMAAVIGELPIESSVDFNQMVEVLDKMDAIVHRHRGAAIGGEAASPISLEAFRAYQQDKKGSDPTSA